MSEKEINEINIRLARIETKLDGMLDKCKTHETDLKKAGDFMLVHETKEKSLLGIRTDLIAWFGLIASIIAIAVNLDKLIK